MKRRSREKKELSFWLVIVSIFLLSFFVLVPEIVMGGGTGILGNDGFFHLNRFTEAAMQIKTGHFSYFQQFYTFNYSGKIVNSFYGPLNAYLQGAILLMVHFKTLVWWSISLWLTNVFGLSSMYYLQRTLKVKQVYALVLGLVFITTGAMVAPVVAGMYAVGYAFIPLIVAASLRLVRDNQRPIVFWELTVALTLLAQTHMLSLVLGLIAYALSFIIFLVRSIWQKINWKIWLFPLVKAVGLVLLLNFNIYGGYFEVKHSNPQMVMPFQSDILYWPSKVSLLGLNFANISVFIALVIALSVLIILWRAKKVPAWVWLALGMTALFSAIATGILNIAVLPEATIFQFFGRFMALAFPFALVLVGYALSCQTTKRKWFTVVTILCTLLSVVMYMGVTANKSLNVQRNLQNPADKGIFTSIEARAKVYQDASLLTGNQLSSVITAPISETIDYLPNHTTITNPVKMFKNESIFYNTFYADIIKMQNFTGSKLQRKVTNDGLMMTWQSANAQKTGLPVIKYGHTVLKLNGKKLTNKDIQLSVIGGVSVKAKEGGNVLTVRYQPSSWFIVGSLLQVIGSLLVLIIIIVKKRKKKAE
ncbi:hypothetical protein ACFO26_04260 [Lactococcus nasutitermitis]|uniref:YfhO family protein n=1 Tax=Lactococcus nasutitermitis TaxID=1652957 RepID=A0ABV9JFM1_9LACT|nr:hypothetical protein [Lactococcus nasutitermitis]